MNADGTSGIEADARVGIKLDWLLPVAIGLIVVGVVLVTGGTLLAVFATRTPRQQPLLPQPTGRRCHHRPARLRRRRPLRRRSRKEPSRRTAPIEAAPAGWAPTGLEQHLIGGTVGHPHTSGGWALGKDQEVTIDPTGTDQPARLLPPID